MNNQPIDPRALKAAQQFRAEVIGLSDESTEQLARIIQSHLAEHQRSESSPEWHHGGGFLCRGTIRVAREDFDTDPSDEFKKQIFDEICAALNNRTPSMADELAEALRDALVELNPETRASSQRARAVFSGLESVLKRYDAQKGRS